MKMPILKQLILFAALFAIPLSQAEEGSTVSDTGMTPADTSKPVQVYILMGQSNMVGMGKVAPAEMDGTLEHAVKGKTKYPYLIDKDGNWVTRNDVRNVFVMENKGNMQLKMNDWLTVKGKTIGPEIGIGHGLGPAIDAPVMLLKSCIGNRSLGWDLLPPGSERYTVDGVTYAGYKDHASAETMPRTNWKDSGKPVAWYAGKQYDDDVANAKEVLSKISEYYPGATKYEIAGFFWWQGDKDRYCSVHAARYEQNLVRLIKALRKDFDAPNAKFVCATLGQTEKGAEGNEGLILNGQLAVDGESGKYPEFKGNVATVFTHPLSLGGASNNHYNGNAETYMNVGEAMGKAMLALMGKP